MLIVWLAALLATLAVAAAAYGAGIWTRRLLPPAISPNEHMVLSWIGGWAALGVVLFLVGQWSFSRAAIGAVVAIGLILAIVRIARERTLPFPRRWRRPVPPGSAIPAAIVGVVLAATAIGGLAEPIGDIGSDGFAYHWAGPKVWLRERIVRPLPDNAPTAYPAAAETVFGALMEFGGARAPAVSAAVTFALFLAVCALTARRCGLGAPGAWWVAALLASMPAVYHTAYEGFIDAFYSALVLASARVAFDAESRRHFVAVGIFCGLAMATKYTGLFVLAPLLACALWPPRGARISEILARALAAAASAALVAAPMYFRNWWFLGSPIYPPPPGWLKFVQIKYMSKAAVDGFYDYSVSQKSGHGRSLWALVTLPINLTYHTADFNGAGGIGLAPLAFGPIGAAAAWRNAFTRRLCVFALLLTLMWFATMQDSRFFIHVYAIATIVAVMGWERAAQFLPRHGRILCAAVVALSVVFGGALMIRSRAADFRSIVSPAYAAGRRVKEIPFIESLDFLNRDPSVSKVMFVDLVVPAYFTDRNYVRAFGQYGERAIDGAATPADALCRAQALGVSHVLDVHSVVADFQIPRGQPGLDLVFERPDQRVYRVTPAFRCR